MALSSWILFVSAVTLSLMSERATAQDTCACSPSKFTFTLDFSLECPPVNVTTTENSGIDTTFCQISPFGDINQKITDLVPVEIQYINIVELGQGFEVLSQKNVTDGPFKNGDSFPLTSIITNGEDDEIPQVIQLNIFALNVLGERILNFYAISYSNDCDAFPVLFEGGSAGWTQFTKLEPPTAEQCPGVSSGEPTGPPLISPTDAPFAASVPPTDAPAVPPTDAPAVLPTDAPAVLPTNPPTPELTMSMKLTPDLEEILGEVMSMSMSMSMDMDMAAESRAFFRLADIADASDIMYEKSEKSAKSEKESKKAKYEKSEKSDKSEKKSKYEKSHKKDKSDKESKKEKTEKTEKKRRLRVRPIYEAV